MEEKKSNLLKVSQIIFAILLAISAGLNIWLLSKDNKENIVEKVVEKEIRDTIHDTLPDIKYKKLISYRHDTIRVIDTIRGDTVHVVAEIPITQSKYTDDSTYTAYVSGYQHNLDSINIYRKTLYVEKTITKTKNQRFYFGPSIGIEYDSENQKIRPNISLSLGYRIFGF